MHRIIVIILLLLLIIYYLYMKKKESYVTIPTQHQNMVKDIYSIVLSDKQINPNGISINNRIQQDISASNLTIGQNLKTNNIRGNIIKSNFITAETVSFIDKNIIVAENICDQNNNCLQQEDIENLNYLLNPKRNRMYFADASNCKIFDNLSDITIGKTFAILGATSGTLTLDASPRPSPPSATVNPFLYNTDKNGFYYTPQANYDSSNNTGFVINIPTPSQLGFQPEVLWVEIYNLYPGGKSFQVSDGANFSVKTGTYYNNYNIIRPDGGISTNSYNLNQNSYWLPIPFNYDTIQSQKKLYISRYICDSSELRICGIAFSTNPWNHLPVTALSVYWNLNRLQSDARTTLTRTPDATGEVDANDEWSIFLNTYGPSKLSNLIVRIPIVNNNKDKILYLISSNDINYGLDTIKGVYIFTNPNVHPSIASTTKDLTKATATDTNDNPMYKLNNFSPSFDNPFARSFNSSNYKRYLATIIPKERITSNFIIIGLQFPVSFANYGWSNTRFKEIGTHDLL